MTSRILRQCALLVAAAMAARGVRAQSTDSSTTDSTRAASPGAARWLRIADAPDVDGANADLWRLAQLRGAPTAGALLRTPSTMMSPLASLKTSSARLRWAIILPSIQYERNSTIPFSLNDGGLWAGKGGSFSITGGLRMEMARLELVVAPRLDREENLPLVFYDNLHSGLPYTLPSYRSVYSTLWNIFPYGADLPFRFGDRTRLYGDPGQSSARIQVGPVKIGITTENEWWGPGLQNALILSNNAGGIPRAFVRSARPLDTPIGAIEF